MRFSFWDFSCFRSIQSFIGRMFSEGLIFGRLEAFRERVEIIKSRHKSNYMGELELNFLLLSLSFKSLRSRFVRPICIPAIIILICRNYSVPDKVCSQTFSVFAIFLIVVLVVLVLTIYTLLVLTTPLCKFYLFVNFQLYIVETSTI